MPAIDNSCKISIITVVYNGAGTIERTIKSVISQSYQNIEYIIIDGLSTDGTQEVVKKYINSIAYFASEKDDGLYDAMNKGLQKATGDIIGIINSDDWYDQYAVERVADFFGQNTVDLVYGKWLSVTREGKVNEYPPEPLDTIWFQMPFTHPAVFIKRNIYEKFGGFNTKYRMAADYELMLRLYSAHVKFRYIDEPIAYFQLGGLSATNKKRTVSERHSISMTYLDMCPNKKDALIGINDAYEWDRFLLALNNKKGSLDYMLSMHFNHPIPSICIFGTGYWGMLCYTALKDGNINVICFADNNPSKWNTEIDGVKIVNPEELQEMDTYVLIAVKEHGDEIRRQLDDMGNPRLASVSIKELRDLYSGNREEQLY